MVEFRVEQIGHRNGDTYHGNVDGRGFDLHVLRDGTLEVNIVDALGKIQPSTDVNVALGSQVIKEFLKKNPNHILRQTL